MGYEVAFLQVGEGGCGGDAIVIRYGNLLANPIQQRIIVIDAGYADTGKAVVSHVKDVYKSDRVDLVLSTHPDNDHVGGLYEVVTELTVGELWMHQPWNHTRGTAGLYKDGRLTDAGISAKLRKALSTARDVETAALRRGITIREPFTGRRDETESLVVLGPTEAYYEALLPQMSCTPDSILEQVIRYATRGLTQKATDAYYSVRESWDRDGIHDDPTPTSAENNSSVVSLFGHDGKYFLFTADAGIPALTNALNALNPQWDLNQLFLVQVPHHGSRHNVGPTILDRMLGPKLPAPAKKRHAFVSVGKEPTTKHPSRRVLNAFTRRGATVWQHEGGTVTFHQGAPPRNWTALTAQPFFANVEDVEANSAVA
jgi:beta-lactamase superfamily II metal-dependent hydrolase